MNRKQFTFYESFFRAISRVRRKASRADIYDAICRFALYGQDPDWEKLGDTCAIAMDLIMPNLRTSRTRAGGTLTMLRGRSGNDEDNLLPEHGKVYHAPSMLPPCSLHAPSMLPPCKGEKENEVEKENENEIEAETEVKGEGQVKADAGFAQGRKGACACENSDFEIFWQAYPKKAAIKQARSAFDQCGQPLDVLLSALEAQKKSAQWLANGGRYIPYPATWLRQQRWEDQLPPPETVGRQTMRTSGVPGEAELAAIARIMQEGG